MHWSKDGTAAAVIIIIIIIIIAQQLVANYGVSTNANSSSKKNTRTGQNKNK
jgi:uncharacterized membrane protein